VTEEEDPVEEPVEVPVEEPEEPEEEPEEVPEEPETDLCIDDNSIADRYGDTCETFYDNSPRYCGEYDTDEFKAMRECCACGGGSTGYYEEQYDYDEQEEDDKND